MAQESSRWRSTAESMGWQARQRVLVPAAASLRATGRSIQDAAVKAATATDNRVVKPVVHQAQSAAADTRHFFTHLGDHHQSASKNKNGRSTRSAPGPATQGFTLEDHLRDSMQSPAVRIVVTVGAISVLLLILRTSMEDSVAKKYSPLDSDDWMDREDGEDGEGGRSDLQYPRAGAAFSGAAAKDAAVLAARASAIVEKGVVAQRGRPAPGRSIAADNGSTPLEIIAPGSQVPGSDVGRSSGSNRKLKAQLEEVRRTVADAKAQEESRIIEQKQLPVFKAAELAGTPLEYQKKSSTYQSEVQKGAAPPEAPKIFRYESRDGSPVDRPTPAATSAKRPAGSATEPFGVKAKRQAAESEEYLRSRGGGAPLVLALGFLSVAASALSPLVMSKEDRQERAWKAQQRRQRWREQADAETELDWERYGKYDMLHELLQAAASDPALQEPRFTPVGALVDAVPKKGAPRYDFLRQLLRGMTSPDPAAAKYDPVWDLLHAAKTKSLPVQAAVRFDPIYNFLNRAAAAADWGLPDEGPVAALLGFDCAGWEPPRYCPVSNVLKSAKVGGAAPWHNNARPQWDPLTAIVSLEVPQGASKYDPLKKAVAAEAPAGRGQVDPLGSLLDIFKRKAGTASAQANGAAPVAIPTGQRDPVLDAVAQQHAVPAAVKAEQPVAVPTGQASPLLQAVAQQHAIPADTKSAAEGGSGAVVSRLTEADLLRERTREPQPSSIQSGWLTAWFRMGAARGAPAAVGGAAAQPSAGAGFVSRLGHSLTTSFGRAQGSPAAAATVPLADIAGERTQPLADALRNAPAAAARAREGLYDPLPDLLRLERGAGTPVMATRDVPGRIGIMLRRDADFNRIVAAFRELAVDGQLTREFRPLYALMRSAAAKPAPSTSADRSQSILEGLDKGAVAEARASAKALLEYLSAPKYAPLQRLLRGRRSVDVVETACALAAIVQPFDNAALAT